MDLFLWAFVDPGAGSRHPWTLQDVLDSFHLAYCGETSRNQHNAQKIMLHLVPTLPKGCIDITAPARSAHLWCFVRRQNHSPEMVPLRKEKKALSFAFVLSQAEWSLLNWCGGSTSIVMTPFVLSVLLVWESRNGSWRDEAGVVTMLHRVGFLSSDWRKGMTKQVVVRI